MKNFNELPVNVQNDIKNDLKAYSECHVVYEYGMYHVGCGVCLKNEYADDHEVIGTYHAEDIFTPNERIINYIESFHDYPIQYKGKRDYRMLKEIGNDWSVRFKFNETGDIVIA